MGGFNFSVYHDLGLKNIVIVNENDNQLNGITRKETGITINTDDFEEYRKAIIFIQR